MDILYKNSECKLNIYKRNTTILTTDDSDKMVIAKALEKQDTNVVSMSNSFTTNSVKQELENFLVEENLINIFNLKSFIYKNIYQLTVPEMALLKIILELAKKPEVLVIYDCLSYLNEDTKLKILTYLKQNNCVLINLTSNEEEILYCNYLIVLNEGLVALEGTTLYILEQEKILKRLGLNLPFVVDLSLQLKAYGLIDRTYSDYKEIVGALWNK